MAGHEEDKHTPSLILIPGKAALEAAETDEGLDALYEEICTALGLEPVDPDDVRLTQRDLDE
jgi:hypothetical protein